MSDHTATAVCTTSIILNDDHMATAMCTTSIYLMMLCIYLYMYISLVEGAGDSVQVQWFTGEEVDDSDSVTEKGSFPHASFPPSLPPSLPPLPPSPSLPS